MALNINGTTGISGVDGSASAPALQGTDSNTGINFASDTVNINTGGVTRTTVDSSGNLNIPVDNAKLQIGASQDLALFHNGSTGNSNISNLTGHLFLQGNNGSGTAVNQIAIKSNASVELNYQGTKKFETTADGIDVSGAAIFHSIGVSNALDIEQQSDANYTGIKIRNFFTGSAKNMLVFLDNNGNVRGSIVINNTVTTYNTTSDYRIKENVVNLTDGITRLKKLKPYKFNFVGDSSNTVDGFFAHEASTVVPEAVTGTKDAVVTQAMIDAGEYTSDKLNQEIHQGIDQSKLVPLLTAALQEAVAKIEVLETKVAALEAG